MNVFSYSRTAPSLREILVPEVKKILSSPLPRVYLDYESNLSAPMRFGGQNELVATRAQIKETLLLHNHRQLSVI